MNTLYRQVDKLDRISLFIFPLTGTVNLECKVNKLFIMMFIGRLFIQASLFIISSNVANSGLFRFSMKFINFATQIRNTQLK